MTDTCHPKVLLCTRYIKFIEPLKTSKKSCVRYLANLVRDDRRTLAGRTISSIARDCHVNRDILSHKDVKKSKYREIPADQKWRSSMLQELLNVRYGSSSIPGVEKEEVEDLIKFICSS